MTVLLVTGVDGFVGDSFGEWRPRGEPQSFTDGLDSMVQAYPKNK